MINQQDKKFLPVLRQSVTVNLYNKSNQSIPYVVQIVPKISQNIIQYIPDFKKQSIKNESLGCKFQDLLSENVLNAMENLDKINNQQKQKNDMAILILKQIINKPLDNKSQKQDAFLKLKIKQESSKQQNSPFYLLELLKNNLQNQGRQVRFTEKADFKTELCLKSLATGFLMDRKMCTVKFQDQQTQWSYDQIASNNVKLINFQKYFRDFVTKKLGINGDNITIHSIKKGSILVTFSTNQTTQLQKAVDGCSSASRYALHPYFSTFNLSPQMFDSRGDINFFNQKHEVQYRGGWPYYQPIKCKRFGLNVLNKFDEKDNSWLSMKGIQGQWVSAFHGVTRPDYKTRDGISILNSIMQGQKINNKIGQQKKIPTAYLKSGSGQYYKDKKSVNGNGNESVGVGIYCTPHIQQTFLYSEPIKREGVQKQYRLIFQCRVNPQKIKVCPKQEYWVINQSKDIRPYGIILMQQSVKKSYPTIENQFKQKFKYENFKNKIMKWKNNQKN